MAQESRSTMRTCADLLLEFNNLNYKCNSSKLNFTGVDDEKDIYNITAPFESDGKYYIAGRVECRDSEDSDVVFFESCGADSEKDPESLPGRGGSTWKADGETPVLKVQDPFAAKIGGELVVGGVEVFHSEDKPGELNYRTVFWRGTSLKDLQRFAAGPDGMKDIRLCGLNDGRILVMTRPQGAVGGRGKIGYLLLDSLEQLNAANIEQARILEEQFVPEEWGGCNELHRLADGRIGVLSHIARFDEKGDRHYYATCFCFDYRTGRYSPMKMTAVRANFADSPAKRPDLEDVIFSGGLVRMGNGRARLYCGVSDAAGHVLEIEDPFLPYEEAADWGQD